MTERLGAHVVDDRVFFILHWLGGGTTGEQWRWAIHQLTAAVSRLRHFTVGKHCTQYSLAVSEYRLHSQRNVKTYKTYT